MEDSVFDELQMKLGVVFSLEGGVEGAIFEIRGDVVCTCESVVKEALLLVRIIFWDLCFCSWKYVDKAFESESDC